MTYFTLNAKKSIIGKTNLKVLQALLNKLQLCQRALGLGYIGENQLITAIQRVCCKVFKLEFGLFTFVTTFEKLFFKL